MFQPKRTITKLTIRLVLAGTLATGMTLTGCNVMIDTHGGALSDESAPSLTNPQNVTSDLRVALEGSGAGMFLSPSTVRIGNRFVLRTSYAYGEEGIEAIYEANDVTVAIHKGDSAHKSPYTESETMAPASYYGQDEQWSLDVDGTVVSCHGKERGKAEGVEWVAGENDKEEYFMMTVQPTTDDASDTAMGDDAVEAMVRSTR